MEESWEDLLRRVYYAGYDDRQLERDYDPMDHKIVDTARIRADKLEQRISELEALCEWQPIETAPCDDTWALVYSIDGMMHIEDLDHDSDWQWWSERGATHWMHLPEPPR